MCLENTGLMKATQAPWLNALLVPFKNLIVCCKGEEEDFSAQCLPGRFDFFSTRVLQDTLWEKLNWYKHLSGV